MYLPRIVSGDDRQLRPRCKFERRVMACLLVPPDGCSRSCQDTSWNEAGAWTPLRPSPAVRSAPVKES